MLAQPRLRAGPGRTGTIAGLFLGFAFSMGAPGAAVHGKLADQIGINAIYSASTVLPVIGLPAWFLPAMPTAHRRG